jgi:hypothetical protein
MKKFIFYFFSVLVIVIALVSFIKISGHVQARPQQQTAYGSETWTTGVTVEDSAEYAGISGRMVTNAASFRSNRGVNHIFYIFPAPAGNRTVSQAKFNILSLNGTPTGVKTMTLEVYSLDSTYLRTLSESVDVTIAAQSSWEDFVLNADSSDLIIAPGEFLAVHFDNEVVEDFQIYPVFEIVTE